MTENVLIALFMDCKIQGRYIKRTTKFWDFPGNDSGLTCSIEHLKYHSSWDWLMPVIGKIESLGYFCMINKWTSVYTGPSASATESRIQITTVEGESKITNTYQAILQFIKWYNSQKHE